MARLSHAQVHGHGQQHRWANRLRHRICCSDQGSCLGRGFVQPLGLRGLAAAWFSHMSSQLCRTQKHSLVHGTCMYCSRHQRFACKLQGLGWTDSCHQFPCLTSESLTCRALIARYPPCADPHIGLLHRGTEKLIEYKTYLQVWAGALQAEGGRGAGGRQRQACCHALQTGNRCRQQHKVADKGGGGHSGRVRVLWSREGVACVNERVTAGRLAGRVLQLAPCKRGVGRGWCSWRCHVLMTSVQWGTCS